MSLANCQLNRCMRMESSTRNCKNCLAWTQSHTLQHSVGEHTFRSFSYATYTTAEQSHANVDWFGRFPVSLASFDGLILP